MATRGLPDTLGIKNFKQSGSGETVGGTLIRNWDAKEDGTMQVRGEMKLIRFVPVTVISAGLLGAAFVTAAAQANPPAAG